MFRGNERSELIEISANHPAQPNKSSGTGPGVRRALVTPMAGCGAWHEVGITHCVRSWLAQWRDMGLNAPYLFRAFNAETSWKGVNASWEGLLSHLSKHERRLRPTHFVPKWMTVRRWAMCSLGASLRPHARRGGPQNSKDNKAPHDSAGSIRATCRVSGCTAKSIYLVEKLVVFQ